MKPTLLTGRSKPTVPLDPFCISHFCLQVLSLVTKSGQQNCCVPCLTETPSERFTMWNCLCVYGHQNNLLLLKKKKKKVLNDRTRTQGNMTVKTVTSPSQAPPPPPKKKIYHKVFLSRFHCITVFLLKSCVWLALPEALQQLKHCISYCCTASSLTSH